MSDDDTLAVTLGSLDSEAEETLTEASTTPPWSACIGLGVRGAWRLTNQQGYSDGVRLEFGKLEERARAVLELIVTALQFKHSWLYLAPRPNKRLERTRR